MRGRGHRCGGLRNERQRSRTEDRQRGAHHGPPQRSRRGLTRRELLVATGALASTMPVLSQPAAWPSERPIRLVVPFSSGGSTDIIARLIADELRPRLNQTVVVENRPGAGSTLGTGQVAKRRPTDIRCWCR